MDLPNVDSQDQIQREPSYSSSDQNDSNDDFSESESESGPSLDQNQTLQDGQKTEQPTNNQITKKLTFKILNMSSENDSIMQWVQNGVKKQKHIGEEWKNPQFIKQYRVINRKKYMQICQDMDMKLFEFVPSPRLLQLHIYDINMFSTEFLAFMDCPVLEKLSIIKCKIANINGINKNLFRNLKQLFVDARKMNILETEINDFTKFSRTAFNNTQEINLSFLFRFTSFNDKYIEEKTENYQLQYNDKNDLHRINDLNFIFKLKFKNNHQICELILQDYYRSLSYLLAKPMFQLERNHRELTQFQLFSNIQQIHLVNSSFLALTKRIYPHMHESINTLKNKIIDYAINIA